MFIMFVERFNRLQDRLFIGFVSNVVAWPIGGRFLYLETRRGRPQSLWANFQEAGLTYFHYVNSRLTYWNINKLFVSNVVAMANLFVVLGIEIVTTFPLTTVDSSGTL
jgi:hypothetical protein